MLSKERKPHLLESETRVLSSGNVLHYTCNPPISSYFLKKKGISCMGYNYGCENDAEMLLIPTRLYLKFFGVEPDKDQNVLIMQSENLLAKLDRIERNKISKLN
jgi:hypothetical protein